MLIFFLKSILPDTIVIKASFGILLEDIKNILLFLLTTYKLKKKPFSLNLIIFSNIKFSS